MGTNCGVELANYYLFSYELDFVERMAADQAHHHILRHFWNMKRYIDDILVIDNPYFDTYLSYGTMDNTGMHGIYPTCLTLEKEQDSPVVVHFLDMAVFYDDTKKLLRTTISDKRDKPMLRHFKMSKYPSHHAMLSRRSRYGVLTSQLHRYHNICSERRHFIWWTRRIIGDLFSKDYELKKLKHTLHWFMRTHTFKFDITDPKVFSDFVCQSPDLDNFIQNRSRTWPPTPEFVPP